MSGTLKRLLFENHTQKIVALALAIGLVAVKREDRTAVMTASVRVRVRHADELVLVSPLVEQVKITLEGTYSSLRDVEVERLPPLDLELPGVVGGEQVIFEPDMFRVPPGVRVRSVTPPAMLVSFEEKRKRSVPVIANLDGEPQGGYRVTQVAIDPPEVVMVGGATSVDALDQVLTERISMVGRRESAVLSVGLSPPPAFVRFIDGGRRYQVTVTIEEKRGTRVISDVPVVVRGLSPESPGYEVTPAIVDVALFGPLRLLDQVEPATLTAYVEVTPEQESRKALKDQEVRFEPPEGLRYSEIKPNRVVLLKRDPPPEPEVDGGVAPTP